MNESYCQIHFILTTNKLLIALLHKIAQFSKCLFINNLLEVNYIVFQLSNVHSNDIQKVLT